MGLSIIGLSALMNLCTVVFAHSPLPETNLEMKSNVNVAMDKYLNEDILTRQPREAQSFLGALWNGIQSESTPLTADQEQTLVDPDTGAPLTEDRARELCHGIERPCEIIQITYYSLFGNTLETRVGRPCPFRSPSLCNNIHNIRQYSRRV